MKKNLIKKKEFHDLEGVLLRIGKKSDKSLSQASNHLFLCSGSALIILDSLKDAQEHPSGNRLYHFNSSETSMEKWTVTLERFAAKFVFFSSLKIKIGENILETGFEVEDSMLVVSLSNVDLKTIMEGLEAWVKETPFHSIGPDDLQISNSWP